MKFSSKTSIYALLSCLALFVAVALELNDKTIYNFFASFFGFGDNAYDDFDRGLFDQRINQFDRFSDKTFEQEFMFNLQYYKEDDPVVLLVIGSLEDFEVTDMLHEYYHQFAKEANALMLGLEVRFYGHSQPFGEQSIKNLSLLNSEQALADIARFIKECPEMFKEKHNVTIPSTAKWVVTGREYGGTLAAWFKMKYPHSAVAALPLGAPMWGTLSYSEYYDRIEKDLKRRNLDSVVKEAYKMIQTKADEGNVEYLESKFKLCDSLSSESGEIIKDNVKLMFYAISYYLGFLSQPCYKGFKNAQIISWNVLSDTKNGDSLGRLAATIEYLMKFLDEACIDVDYKDTVAKFQNADVLKMDVPRLIKYGIGTRAALYQRCFELGNFEVANETNMFYEYIPKSFYFDLCENVFQTKMNGDNLEFSIANTERFYGSLNYEGRNAIFINSEADHYIPKELKESRKDTERIVVHVDVTAREFSEVLDGDKPKLKEKYERIFKPLLRWLGKSTEEAENEYVDDPQQHNSEACSCHDIKEKIVPRHLFRDGEKGYMLEDEASSDNHQEEDEAGDENPSDDTSHQADSQLEKKEEKRAEENQAEELTDSKDDNES